MAGDSEGDSPLDAIAGAAAPHAAESFELLANDTRLAILLALWDAYEPFSRGGALSFSELRDIVGVRDSGQFNYHLGKLEGRFVESTEDGYRLRPAGEKVTRAVIGGAGVEAADFDPASIDLPCVRCDAPTELRYLDGRLVHRCTECGGNFGETDALPEGTLFVWRLEPAGLPGRSPAEVYAAASKGMFHRVLAVIDGVCPECSGAIETRVDVCEEHAPDGAGVCPSCGRGDEILVLNQCGVCKFTSAAAPTDLVTHHPAVVGFYHDHGVDVQYDLDVEAIQRLFELEAAHEQTIESRDPLRVLVTVRVGDDAVSLRFGEDMTVLEVIE